MTPVVVGAEAAAGVGVVMAAVGARGEEEEPEAARMGVALTPGAPAEKAILPPGQGANITIPPPPQLGPTS